MNNKVIAYTGFFLVPLCFLVVIALLIFHKRVEFVDNIFEGAMWGSFAVAIAGGILGVCSWKTTPGKVAACFGGIMVVGFLACLLSTSSSPQSVPPMQPDAHGSPMPLQGDR